MTQKYYVPITVIVEVNGGYLDEQDLKGIASILREDIRNFLNEVDIPSDEIQDNLSPENIELVHIGVEEPIFLS